MSFESFSLLMKVYTSPLGLHKITSYLVIFPLLFSALGMNHDTLMSFFPRGMMTTSRGGPLGAGDERNGK